jgi:hypothetical protein
MRSIVRPARPGTCTLPQEKSGYFKNLTMFILNLVTPDDWIYLILNNKQCQDSDIC